ncbi:MAG: response regulator transcription factor [Chloroflexi bacterium]|nr:response regulator transcription factor [Chloroflexota bacterium]
MPRILIVEDEANIADFLQRGLVYKGYEVDVAHDGESALAMARDRPPDLVVLDLMLPGLDGIEVCRRLRAASDVGIVVLTARDAVSDRIQGLEAGADDYVLKPFVFDELLARLRAVQRRRSPGSKDVIRIGDMEVDTAAREVRRRGGRISLTPKEYELLEVLARNARRVLSREAIFEKVWGYDHAGEADPVKVYVSYLRRKLGEPEVIHTVRGFGYVLRE